VTGRSALVGVGLVVAGALAAGCAAKTTGTAPPLKAPSPRAVKDAPPRSSPPAPPAAEPPPATAVLSPQMTPADETRLRQLATARIEDTERIVQRIDQRKLDADQRQTFSTVQTFLVKARDALGANDVQGAYNLADKARVLAGDLARR
jgi:hypothetical protein